MKCEWNFVYYMLIMKYLSCCNPFFVQSFKLKSLFYIPAGFISVNICVVINAVHRETLLNLFSKFFKTLIVFVLFLWCRWQTYLAIPHMQATSLRYFSTLVLPTCTIFINLTRTNSYHWLNSREKKVKVKATTSQRPKQLELIPVSLAWSIPCTGY